MVRFCLASYYHVYYIQIRILCFLRILDSYHCQSFHYLPNKEMVRFCLASHYHVYYLQIRRLCFLRILDSYHCQSFHYLPNKEMVRFCLASHYHVYYLQIRELCFLQISHDVENYHCGHFVCYLFVPPCALRKFFLLYHMLLSHLTFG